MISFLLSFGSLFSLFLGIFAPFHFFLATCVLPYWQQQLSSRAGGCSASQLVSRSSPPSAAPAIVVWAAQVALQNSASALDLAVLLPKQWQAYLRPAPTAPA